MIKPFILVIFCGCCQLVAIAQSPWTGTWEGKINAGVPLRIDFHFLGIGDQLTATMDSPDQGAFGLPVETSYFGPDSVFLSMKNFGISYSGKRTTDSTIEGYFTQGGRIPLLLKKVLKVEKLSRPQTPVPPFPYRSEEVFFYNHDIKLSGTLTLPTPAHAGKNDKRSPALLLITGSGPQNRDEEIMGHRPFSVLADYLTRRGFIVLRVDDRGIGQSTGDFKKATSIDFAADANAAIEFLRSRPETDTTRLGMLGHSEGGIIAPLVAVSRQDINFIILLAAPGVKSSQLMREQNEAMLRSKGTSPLAQGAYGNLYSAITNSIATSSDANGLKAAEKVMEQWTAATPPALLRELSLDQPSDRDKLIRSFHEVFSIPWFRNFMRYDPQPVLEKLNAKVLAINGEKDIQVLAGSNLAGIQHALAKTKCDFEIHEMKGLNHLLQHCTSCTITEYSQLEETLAPEVLSLLGDWLTRKVANQQR